MLHFLDPVRGLGLWTVLIKLSVAFVLGGAIGIERSYKNRPAGFRTHILVCVAAAVASMTGIYIYINDALPADVSRIGAAVVSGLGFLGAGTIIVTRQFAVKGLTTAAGLWTSGVIGLAVGAGFYEGAVVTAVLVLFTETALGGLANRIKRDPEFTLRLRYAEKPSLDRVMRCCKDFKLGVVELQVVGDPDSQRSAYVARILLRPRMKVDKEALFEALGGIDGVLDLQELEAE